MTDLVDGTEVPFPWLDVRAPGGQPERHDLVRDATSIGRFMTNDIVLSPDPDSVVSGSPHCRVERGEGGWRVVDRWSQNGTYLRHGDILRRVEDAHLVNGDVICVLAQNHERVYWELVFNNPAETVPAEFGASTAELEHDPLSGLVFRLDGRRRHALGHLRKQLARLLAYLFDQVREDHEGGALCSREQLKRAVWGQETHTDEELNRLILDLRRAIEPNSAKPRFLQTVPKFGYRFDPRPGAGPN